MTWITLPRVAAVVVAALLIAFVVIANQMGMMGDMFTPFFGGPGPTPTARAGSAGAPSGATAPRATPSPTVRR
jgi:hypothetical protein